MPPLSSLSVLCTRHYTTSFKFKPPTFFNASAAAFTTKSFTLIFPSVFTAFICSRTLSISSNCKPSNMVAARLSGLQSWQFVRRCFCCEIEKNGREQEVAFQGHGSSTIRFVGNSWNHKIPVPKIRGMQQQTFSSEHGAKRHAKRCLLVHALLHTKKAPRKLAAVVSGLMRGSL